jgi:hypothetical protein
MEYINDFYEYINDFYEYVYENNNFGNIFNGYFQSEKPDIFENINFDNINIYTVVNVLNDRKQNINKYFIPNNFDVSDKLSILKYRLSFCLKSTKDMSDDMIKHIENYKFNTEKIKNNIEIEKIINDTIIEIKDDIEMVNLEKQYNKLRDDVEIINLENRLNKLKEEEDEKNDNGNGGATGILIKQSIHL